MNKESKKHSEVKLGNWMLSSFKCMDKNNLTIKGLEYLQMIMTQIILIKSKK